MNEMLQWPLNEVVTQLNALLASNPDKDWNYSRISLSIRPLDSMESPYVLWPEAVDPVTAEGRADLRTLSEEIKWGERHSSELGILEIISLRINKALLENRSDQIIQNRRIVLRIVKKHLLAEQGIREALWYDVQEVAGEDFDNR
jgi:hypothetical protein